jgi:hypothetical protein
MPRRLLQYVSEMPGPASLTTGRRPTQSMTDTMMIHATRLKHALMRL